MQSKRVWQLAAVAGVPGLLWFIGTRGIVGPTDEEKRSSDRPVSTIEMKRIQARHMDEILSIPGVHRFDIGTKGFTVGLLLPHRENRPLIPRFLEGIPVEVKITELTEENMYGYSYRAASTSTCDPPGC